MDAQRRMSFILIQEPKRFEECSSIRRCEIAARKAREERGGKVERLVFPSHSGLLAQPRKLFLGHPPDTALARVLPRTGQ